MALHESGENYLEVILLLQRRDSIVRAIDIANELGYAKPSITKALGILKKDGYVAINESRHISLTRKGLSAAKRIYERHELLVNHLQWIGVDKENARQDACRIEHVISDKTYECIKKHAKKNNYFPNTI